MKSVIRLSAPCPDWRGGLPDAAALAERAARAAIAKVAAGAPGAAVEVSIVLADDATLRALNRDFRGIDKPTNVLSFPQHSASGQWKSRGKGGKNDAPCLLGDVVLGFETVAREARRESKPLGDHVSHLVVHGVLHLFGYDHESDDDATIMESLETRILAGMNIPDPYSADD